MPRSATRCPNCHDALQLADYYPAAHTEGLLWFTDLGAPDPIHVLYVLACRLRHEATACLVHQGLPSSGC